MGALAPILYQGAIPVFADVDPRTGNVTAATDRGPRSRTAPSRSSRRTCSATRATSTAIRALADARGIPVIEDCAQAFLARRAGRLVGTIGAIGCFSSQQGKHMTTGEGGLVVTDDAGATPGGSACSSTRPGPTARRSPTTSSSRSTPA